MNASLADYNVTNLIALHNASGREAVGIEDADGHVWLMNNIAEDDKAFRVSGVELLELMENENVTPVRVWHTHAETLAPSVRDLETFPSWLVEECGIVLVQTGQQTLYRSDGSVSPTIRFSSSKVVIDDGAQATSQASS